MKITNELIRGFNPCYDPAEIGIPENEELTPVEWIEKHRNSVKNKSDIIWLFCRNEFLNNKDLRLFAVWCAREAIKLIENPDQRIVNCCNVSEKFANGDATEDELSAARRDAHSAAHSAACSAAYSAAYSAAHSADDYAAYHTAYHAARSAAHSAACSAAYSAACYAAYYAARYADDYAARYADDYAAYHAAHSAQIDQLLMILKS